MPRQLEAVAGNIHFLEQGIEVLRRLEDTTYAGHSTETGSPVGAHFRHILDHYRSFFEGVDSGRVDYDARERDPRLERERGYAIEVSVRVAGRLAAIDGAIADRPLLVNVNSGGSEEEIPDWSASTVKRELQFLASHTVHHYALIKEILRRGGFDPGDDFGVAPSTLAHLRSQACAR